MERNAGEFRLKGSHVLWRYERFCRQSLRTFVRLNAASHDSSNIGTEVCPHVGRPTHAAVAKEAAGRRICCSRGARAFPLAY